MVATKTPTQLPTPTAVADLADRLAVMLESPFDAQRARIGRLYESVWIQMQGLRGDLDTLRDLSLPDEARAAAEGSFHSTLQEIAFLKLSIAEAEADLQAAITFAETASTCSLISRQSESIAPAEYDRLVNLQDVMAGMHATLADHNHLDLIGGA